MEGTVSQRTRPEGRKQPSLTSERAARSIRAMEELIRLKDGQRARLRPVTVADARAVCALDRALVEAGVGMVLTEDDLPEGPAAELEEVKARLERHQGAKGAWLLAEGEGGDPPVLAQAGISRLGPGLLRHVAVLDVGVHPSAQGLGLGRALMERAIHWATAGAGATPPAVSRLELYVRADNPRARRLYASLGFEVEGVRRGFVRTPEGAFVDDLVMARLLETGTQRHTRKST